MTYEYGKRVYINDRVPELAGKTGTLIGISFLAAEDLVARGIQVFIVLLDQLLEDEEIGYPVAAIPMPEPCLNEYHNLTDDVKTLTRLNKLLKEVRESKN